MPLTVAGRRLSNGALVVGAGLVVGVIDAFLPWHSTTAIDRFGTVSNGFRDALGYWSGWIFFLAALAGVVLFAIRLSPSVVRLALPWTDAVIYLAIGMVMCLCAVVWFVSSGGLASTYLAYQFLPGYQSGPSFGVFVGILVGGAIAAGGQLLRGEPQPPTKRLSSYRLATDLDRHRTAASAKLVGPSRSHHRRQTWQTTTRARHRRLHRTHPGSGALRSRACPASPRAIRHRRAMPPTPIPIFASAARVLPRAADVRDAATRQWDWDRRWRLRDRCGGALLDPLRRLLSIILGALAIIFGALGVRHANTHGGWARAWRSPAS